MAIPAFKTCHICKQSLDSSEFSSFAQSSDGLYSYCRCCERKRRKRKRLENDPAFALAEAERERAFSEARSGEVWKDIPGWEGWYQASSHGRIRSLPRKVNAPNRWGDCIRTYPGRIMKQRPTRHYGHMTVGLQREGKLKQALVHRLVCETFHGPCPPDKQHCAHGDGDPTNNRPENLRWATVKENAEDTRRHGNLRMGEQSNLARLTEADVLAIRERAAAGESCYRIAKDVGFSTVGIIKIVKRENWKHI